MRGGASRPEKMPQQRVSKRGPQVSASPGELAPPHTYDSDTPGGAQPPAFLEALRGILKPVGV